MLRNLGGIARQDVAPGRCDQTGGPATGWHSVRKVPTSLPVLLPPCFILVVQRGKVRFATRPLETKPSLRNEAGIVGRESSVLILKPHLIALRP